MMRPERRRPRPRGSQQENAALAQLERDEIMLEQQLDILRARKKELQNDAGMTKKERADLRIAAERILADELEREAERRSAQAAQLLDQAQKFRKAK